MFTTLRKVAVAAFAAGALLFSGATAAVAVPESLVDDSKAPGSIHLVKYDDGAGAGVAADGTNKQGDALKGATPLDGITFTLSQVTKLVDGNAVDITTNAGQIAAAALDAAKVAADKSTYGVTKNSEKTTANGGKIDFEGLDLGVYLLEETNSTVNGKTYRAAAPSLVFLPMTNPDDQSSYIEENGKYTVYVYPKNSLDENLKQIEDTNKQVGDTITYTVSATVPAVQKLATAVNNRTYNLKDFGFWDNLDSKLQLVSTSSVEVSYGTAAGANKLTADDFKATLYKGDGSGDKATGATDEVGQELVVVLTDSGLEKVATAKAGNASTKVFLTFSPKVMKSGVVPNTAIVYKNTGDGAGAVDPGKPGEKEPSDASKTNTVYSAWGNVRIYKHGTVDENDDEPLYGAEFEVYGVTGGVYGTDQAAKIDYSKSIFTENGKAKKFVTGKDGYVTIEGLHANNLVDSVIMPKVGDNQYTSYVLVETKAPTGYELAPEPIPFTIEVDSVDYVTTTSNWKINENGDTVPGSEATDVIRGQYAIAAGATYDDDSSAKTLVRLVDVTNMKSKPKLPLTGGAGVAAFGLLGLAIVAGGVVYARRNSKEA